MAAAAITHAAAAASGKAAAATACAQASPPSAETEASSAIEPRRGAETAFACSGGALQTALEP